MLLVMEVAKAIAFLGIDARRGAKCTMVNKVQRY